MYRPVCFYGVSNYYAHVDRYSAFKVFSRLQAWVDAGSLAIL
tara:strand:+ start:159 stop:284 length:126 start_codon:yes stop_codon:yes gene_type:complete